MPIVLDSLSEAVGSYIPADNVWALPRDDDEIAARDVIRQVVDRGVMGINHGQVCRVLHRETEPKALRHLSGRMEGRVELLEEGIRYQSENHGVVNLNGRL